MMNKSIYAALKFFREKINKIICEREQRKSDLFKQTYAEKSDKRMELESVVFNNKEKAYVLALILQDEILNSHKHTSQGLYSETDNVFLDFVSKLREKINKM